MPADNKLPPATNSPACSGLPRLRCGRICRRLDRLENVDWGYPVHELSDKLRAILGLGREWRVIIIGAGKIGAALANYHGFYDRGFRVVGVYDNNPAKIGHKWGDAVVRDMADLERDVKRDNALIAVLAIPADDAQAVADRIVKAGIRAILNFAPAQLQVPQGVSIKTVNMAMELEGLSFALTNMAEPGTRTPDSSAAGVSL
jgi:redox-sensing transcriptional repressor